MTPRRLSATNFRTWEHLDLELPAGVTAIIGQNGAGKSSLLTLIDVCLFGARSLADHLTTGEDAMQIQLEFEHQGQLLRVRRTYSARGRGQSKVDLERYALRANVGGQTVDFPEVTPGEGDWQPLTRETAAETQALIEQTLGLSRATFRASAFLAQGDGAAFTEASPRDRKQILSEILDLSLWERLLELARADRAADEVELAKLHDRIETANRDLAAMPDVQQQHANALAMLDHAKHQLERTETELARARELAQAAREATVALDAAVKLAATLASQAEAIQARVGELQDEDVTIQEHLADRDTLAAAASGVAELELAVEGRRALAAAAREHADARVALGHHEQAAAAANEHLARVEHASQPTCPTCEQPLPDVARATTLAKLRRARDDAADAVKGAQENVRAAELAHAAAASELGKWADAANDPAPALANARAAADQLARLDTMAARLPKLRNDAHTLIAQLTQLGQDRAAAQERIVRLREQAPDPAIAERIAELERAVDRDRGRIGNLEREAAVHQATIERLHTIAVEAEENRGHADAVAANIETLRCLERAYGPNGIPALILENTAIPHIETEANRILTELDTTYRVELRTQRALKSGDGHREALDIVVTDNGTDRMYETFSGGERTRLNLALRIALARLLSHRRGTDVRLLALDEPEFLDEHGMDNLARVLHTLTGDFDTIVVVSHVPALREAFDQTIEISKADGRSQIAAHTAPTEVAA